jgi:hypothetical protein
MGQECSSTAPAATSTLDPTVSSAIQHRPFFCLSDCSTSSVRTTYVIVRGLFLPAVWVARKPCRVSPMHRRAHWPGPAAKLGTSVVLHRLHDLSLGVHHEWPVLDHRLADRLALQQQKLTQTFIAVVQFHGVPGPQFDGCRAFNAIFTHCHGFALEEKQVAARAFARGGGQFPAGAGLHGNRLARNIRIRLGRPGVGWWGQGRSR